MGRDYDSALETISSASGPIKPAPSAAAVLVSITGGVTFVGGRQWLGVIDYVGGSYYPEFDSWKYLLTAGVPRLEAKARCL